MALNAAVGLLASQQTFYNQEIRPPAKSVINQNQETIQDSYYKYIGQNRTKILLPVGLSD